MNIRSNPDTTRPAVTTGPLAASRKIFVTPDEAPDLLLLLGGELRPLVGHASATVTTTLPNCSPEPSRSNARRPCSSGISESTGG